jgi:hypothetical protein
MIYVAVQPSSEPQRDARRRDTITRFFEAIQAGDFPVLHEILAAGAVTVWPQSGERITGSMACARVYETYPGGPPTYLVKRISGAGDLWVAELVADYGVERWHAVSVIEFEGPLITQMTDYFGPSLAAPDWRRGLVELDEA